MHVRNVERIMAHPTCDWSTYPSLFFRKNAYRPDCLSIEKGHQTHMPHENHIQQTQTIPHVPKQERLGLSIKEIIGAISIKSQ